MIGSAWHELRFFGIQVLSVRGGLLAFLGSLLALLVLLLELLHIGYQVLIDVLEGYQLHVLI